MLRQFDAEAGWNNGLLSCAHWLNWRTGIDLARRAKRPARHAVQSPYAIDVLYVPRPPVVS